VFFIDQHVAHERVLFEQLKRELADGPLASQALLFPQSLELGPGKAALLAEWQEDLSVSASPSRTSAEQRAPPRRAEPLKGAEPRRLIEASSTRWGRPRRSRILPSSTGRSSFVACRAAVKAHAPLQREEMARLLSDLSATETPYFLSRTGRPIVSRLSLKDIKRELKRTW
jgi:DNA mismatch repair protein MutL